MVRICRRVSGASAAAVILAAHASVAAAAAATPNSISLQLHRLPDSDNHHETYQRRRLKGIDDAFESVPLNLGMGTHYAWVYAGTPPQRASVITDTGSSIMAFPCSGCAGCGHHTDQPFAALNSSTLAHVTCGQSSFFRCEGCANSDKKTCDISQSYMEGSSWHATVVEDIVYLGGEKSFQDTEMRNTYGTHFKFGCQNHETGLFISQVADGIMGLANNDNHLVAQLFKEQKIPNKLFTLCFAPDGGAMSIGAPDTSRHKGEIKYAELVGTSSHDFYGVELRDVRVAGASIDAPPTSYQHGQFIVDSGTTDSYLPSSMKPHLAAAFEKATGLGYHTSSASCKGYTDEDLEKLPNIEFVLGAVGGGNLTLTVTPSQYLLQEDSGKYCSSIFLSEARGGVIGANIMMGHDVIFDQGNQRVGFVEADCHFHAAPVSSVPEKKDTNATATTTTPTATTTETEAPEAPEAPEPVMTLGVETEEPEPTTAMTPPEPVTTAPVETTAPVPTASESPVPTSSSTTPPVTDDTPSLIPVEASPSPAPSITTTPSPPETTTTETPTTAPVASTKAPETPEPANNVEKPSPTTTAPTSTSTTNMHADGTHTAANGSGAGATDEAHPMVLTIVGTILAVAFIVVAAFSVRHHKKASQDPRWSRVKGNEEDDDAIDDEDEEELIVHTVGGKSKAAKAKTNRRSDELGSDEDDDSNDDDDDDDDDDDNTGNVRRGGRLAIGDDDDDDDDEDDDDEIFEREADDHAHHQQHDLERL